MNQPQVYMCPPILNPSATQLPPNPIPLGCPSSYIKFALVIYFTYGNIHVSMLFSHIIPPSPSPTVQKSVLYICVSFAATPVFLPGKSHGQKGTCWATVHGVAKELDTI